MLIGWGTDCNLVVKTSLVSRIHARGEYHRGKFVLIDQSTNRTFVRSDSEREIYLRREQMPLVGGGRAGLGQAPNAALFAEVVHEVES